MSTPELLRPAAPPDTELMDVHPSINGDALKKILTVLLGGSGVFFPEEVQETPGVIDWEQWGETSSLRAEWAEQARLERLRWIGRMESG